MEGYLVVASVRWQTADFWGCGSRVWILRGTVYLPDVEMKLMRYPVLDGYKSDIEKFGPTELKDLLEFGRFGLNDAKVRRVQVDDSLVERVFVLKDQMARLPKELGAAVGSLCDAIPPL